MSGATVSAIGTGASNGSWTGGRSGNGAGSRSAVTSSNGSSVTTPAVVIAPVVVKPAVNKTLLYVGAALLLWMVLKNKKHVA